MDISTAAAIGLVSLSALAAWTPQGFQAASLAHLEEASLSDYLASVVSAQGVTWFQASTFEAICARLSSYSNSTLVVSATEGGDSCVSVPSRFAASAELALPLEKGRVTLWAWRVAGP